MIEVLFVCIHNSARSQMAEAFLNQYGKDHFHAESAGLEKGKLNAYVVKAMLEIGIDISSNQTKTTADMLELKKSYDYVITVCDQASKERCPIFPNVIKYEHLNIEDPSKLEGTEKEIMKKVRIIRDEIKERILLWIKKIEK